METWLVGMEKRYKIPSSIQKQYLQKVEQVSGMRGDELASYLGIVGRTYRDWRRGKFSLPAHVIERIRQRFHVSPQYPLRTALIRWKTSKTLAGRMGALAALTKYGALGSPEGRSKGGKKAMQVLRARGLIPEPKPFYEPPEYSVELAEFVGILLGDGHIGKEQWSITVNSKADRQYAKFIFYLAKKLFHFAPGRYIRHDCHVRIICGSGQKAISYFTSIGLVIGNKIKQQVGIPSWISQKMEYRIACLRGLVDTDGGIFVHKYRVNNKLYSYPKLSFVNRSLPILSFVYETLLMVQLHPKIRLEEESKRVWLYNQKEVLKYLERVSTNNPRLLKNIKSTFGGVR